MAGLHDAASGCGSYSVRMRAQGSVVFNDSQERIASAQANSCSILLGTDSISAHDGGTSVTKAVASIVS